MSLMDDYITRKLTIPELQAELQRLIAEYNTLRNTYLFVYCAAIGKPIPFVPLDQTDFFIIRDMLTHKKGTKNLDFYIETPGGSGQAAEEIVRFTRNNFENISFVISGEAKSAGTILALSGDEILMTETGSLGPIDAQVTIGRSVASAYDYIEWVEEKQQEAEKTGKLNPFDAIMVAQITPGELGSVFHALKFAEDLVVEWLTKYKFKNWKVTESRQQIVSDEIKKKRAEEIARLLCNHSKWRLHGRSIKIDDLEEIGLKITRVDKDDKLADIVYRIQTVCRFIFDSSSIYKIFATAQNKIFKSAAPAGIKNKNLPAQIPDIVEIKEECPQCGEQHKIYGKLTPNQDIDRDLQKNGFKPFPKDDKIVCKCGYELDLLGIKNDIESKTGRKIIKEEAKNVQ